MTKKIDDIIPKAGRVLLKDAGILIFPEWDIANAMVFDGVRREGKTRFRIEEEVHMAHKGVKFSVDHKALVLCSLQDRKDTQAQEIADKVGSLMVYRVGEICGTEVAMMIK